MTERVDIPVYRNEKRLFVLMAIFSGIFWLAIVLSTLGIALLIIPVVFLLYLFLQSAFISHIKGTAAKITACGLPAPDKTSGNKFVQSIAINKGVGLDWFRGEGDGKGNRFISQSTQIESVPFSAFPDAVIVTAHEQ